MAKFNFGRFIGLARDTDPQRPVADIAQARQAAAEELQAAQTGIEAAEGAYRVALLDPDQDVVLRLGEARTLAGVRRDRAEALLAALDAKLAEVRERDRQAEVARLVSDSERATAAFRAFVEAELPGMGEKARRMMELRYAAESARVDAQLAMHRVDPEAAPVLPDVEAWRSVSGLSEEVLDEREVELWLRPNGTPLEENLYHEVKLQPDGTGIRWHGSGQSTRYSQRRRFLRRVRLNAGAGAYVPSIATVLSIPPLTAQDQAGWVPLQGTDLVSLASAIQRPPGSKVALLDDREVRVTFDPIGEPFNTFQPQTAVIGGPGQEPARRLA